MFNPTEAKMNRIFKKTSSSEPKSKTELFPKKWNKNKRKKNKRET